MRSRSLKEWSDATKQLKVSNERFHVYRRENIKSISCLTDIALIEKEEDLPFFLSEQNQSWILGCCRNGSVGRKLKKNRARDHEDDTKRMIVYTIRKTRVETGIIDEIKLYIADLAMEPSQTTSIVLEDIPTIATLLISHCGRVCRWSMVAYLAKTAAMEPDWILENYSCFLLKICIDCEAWYKVSRFRPQKASSLNEHDWL